MIIELSIEQKVIHTYYGTAPIEAETEEQAIEIFEKLSQSEKSKLFDDNLEDGGITGTEDIKLC